MYYSLHFADQPDDVEIEQRDEADSADVNNGSVKEDEDWLRLRQADNPFASTSDAPGFATTTDDGATAATGYDGAYGQLPQNLDFSRFLSANDASDGAPSNSIALSIGVHSNRTGSNTALNGQAAAGQSQRNRRPIDGIAGIGVHSNRIVSITTVPNSQASGSSGHSNRGPSNTESSIVNGSGVDFARFLAPRQASISGLSNLSVPGNAIRAQTQPRVSRSGVDFASFLAPQALLGVRSN